MVKEQLAEPQPQKNSAQNTKIKHQLLDNSSKKLKITALSRHIDNIHPGNNNDSGKNYYVAILKYFLGLTKKQKHIPAAILG